MQPPPPSPEIHERSEQPDAQRDAPVSCHGQGQREEQPVGRIEQRQLHGAKKRRSSKNVRIPQGEVALRQLAEAEFSPPEKMQRQVVPGIRSEEHTSELQSQSNLVCRLLLEKKKKKKKNTRHTR